MYAGVVPVPVDCPEGMEERAHPDVVSSGFLLSACGVGLALTDEASRRLLTEQGKGGGEVGRLKGWPALEWIGVDHLTTKPPKTLMLPVTTPPHCVAYIATSRHREQTADHLPFPPPPPPPGGGGFGGP